MTSVNKERDPEKEYEIEVPGEFFVNPPPEGHSWNPFRKKVFGKIINEGKCPLCNGTRFVYNFKQRDDITVEINNGKGMADCPLCGGDGTFDYSKAKISM